MKTFEMKTVIHFGDNSLDRLAELPYKKVLVITDPFIAKGEMINLITEPLKRGGKEFEVFSDVVPDASPYASYPRKPFPRQTASLYSRHPQRHLPHGYRSCNAHPQIHKGK